MSIYPTRTAAHVAVTGLVILALGVALGQYAVVAWGGAVLIALSVARIVTMASVVRIRAAGFEMLWSGALRVVSIRRGQRITVAAEVRNRDTLAARFDGLRVVASPALDVSVTPRAGEVPAGGLMPVAVTVIGRRVGQHGIYGLALECRGAPGLFEIPLTFANPYGILVQPRALARALAQPHGGRSGLLAAVGRAGRRRGDGTELRELREHQPGDPFRRIAWKASARRGVLVVREFEREERDVVLLVLDASVELWSGAVGEAPLDRAIDVTAALASRHLSHGDRVGLTIIGSRRLGHVPPAAGREQATKIAAALVSHTGVFDSDRSGWDESDLLLQVAEHLRPLDGRAVADLRRGQIDRLVKRATRMRRHAPFAVSTPYGRSARDRRLRRYAASFGMHLPARIQPDHPRTVAALAEVLAETARARRATASVVHVVGPAPAADEVGRLAAPVRRLRRLRAVVRWTSPALWAAGDSAALQAGPTAGVAPLAPSMLQAVHTRVLVAQRQGEAGLRRIGVRVVRPPRHGAPSAGDDEADASKGAPQGVADGPHAMEEAG